MEDDGIENFFKQLGLDASKDLEVLLVSKYMKAAQMGCYTKVEFETGCKALGCDTMEKWKSVVQSKLKPELKNKAKFQELVTFVFIFAQDLGKRNVETDTAIALWELLLKPQCNFF